MSAFSQRELPQPSEVLMFGVGERRTSPHLKSSPPSPAFVEKGVEVDTCPAALSCSPQSATCRGCSVIFNVLVSFTLRARK